MCQDGHWISLLYETQGDACKEKFREYLIEKVVKRTEDTDNALKKFFRALILQFQKDSNELYLTSNITDILEKL